MERLTIRREDGSVETTGRVYSEIHMDYVDCTRGNDKYDVRLAEYEDTGLTPEEAKGLAERLHQAVADNAALEKEFERLLSYDSLQWLHDGFRDIIFKSHPGDALLKELVTLQSEKQVMESKVKKLEDEVKRLQYHIKTH